MDALKVASGSWPMRGGLTSITNTPSYRPGKYTIPARNAFIDGVTVAPVSTQPKLSLIDPAKPKNGTPSPKKTGVSTEDRSPAGKENVRTTPNTTT